ncbi:MAG: T9SS type A sorting domain-containing protein [Alphaproteobacteria bacterium]|nr:T9SS type A sorting domain-containing protein [Alphaproteobacteria bacterium]
MKRLINGSALCLTILLYAGEIHAQQGTVAAGGVGNGPGGSVAISVGQTDYLFYSTDQGSVSFGVQHSWDGTTPPLPVNLQIPDQVIGNGESLCYNATAVITVAGGSNNFLVQPGGSAELIAGQRILMLAGTHVQNGGYLIARVNPGGPWCIQPFRSDESQIAKDRTPNQVEPVRNNGLLFSIYPNPTTGDFTLELDRGGDPKAVFLEIFTLEGRRIFQQSLYGECMYTVSMAGYLPGLYIIVVKSAYSTGMCKIIRY